MVVACAACGTTGYVKSGETLVYKTSTADGTNELPLPSANPASIHAISTDYAIDDSSVFYRFRRILGADPQTFTVLRGGFSKDKNAVFSGELKLNGSDPATFEILSDGYSKDRGNVYFGSKVIQGADPSSFQKTRRAWRDNRNLYRAAKAETRIDAATYKEDAGGVWAYDINRAYVGTSAIEPDDIASFKVLPGVYAKDRSSFYAAADGVARKIVPVDPSTFQIIDTHWAKDSSAMYWTGLRLVGARPASFKILTNVSGMDGETCYVRATRVFPGQCDIRYRE